MLQQQFGWIDMHVHLDKLEGGPENAIHLAKEAGLEKLITIGTDLADLPVVIELAEKYAPDVFCTIGIHPHDGATYNDEVKTFIRENLNKKVVVAVGEIGLDYYYLQSSKEQQLHAFREQLEIAAEFKMPVEIHTRDAEEDTVNLLKEFEGKVTGLIHCFTGSQWLADRCLELGYNISISGVVTFKNADALRSVVKSIPLDRIHVETDAPFLAPVPMRGKANTSAYMIHTAKMVSELKEISMQQLAKQTRENALKLFPKLTW